MYAGLLATHERLFAKMQQPIVDANRQHPIDDDSIDFPTFTGFDAPCAASAHADAAPIRSSWRRPASPRAGSTKAYDFETVSYLKSLQVAGPPEEIDDSDFPSYIGSRVPVPSSNVPAAATCSGRSVPVAPSRYFDVDGELSTDDSDSHIIKSFTNHR